MNQYNESLLPIGTEYEIMTYLSPNSNIQHATVFRYKVVEHITTASGAAFNKIECISSRKRNVIRTWSDGFDMYGRLVMRAEFDGKPPSPTYEEAQVKYFLNYTLLRE